MATLASVVVKLGANTSGFISDFSRAAKVSETSADRMKRTMKKVGPAAIAMGGSVATGMGLAIREARAFETAMAEVSTLLDDTSSIDGMAASLRDLSRQYGQAPTEQARALYQIISAGAADAASQISLLETANRLAIGGLTQVETAADALTTVLNAYGMEASEAGRVSDVFFATMRGGKTTVNEVATSIGQVATIAAQTGVSIEELGAATATLTKAGLDTGVSMNALRQVMVSVIKPSEKAVSLADELGIQFDAAGLASKGLAGFLAEVQAKTGGSATALAALFGRVEGLTAVMSLGADESREFSAQMLAMANAAGETDKAYEKMAATVDQQLNKLTSTIRVAAGILGEQFLPAINNAAQAYLDFLEISGDSTRATENAAKAARSLARDIDSLTESQIRSNQAALQARWEELEGDLEGLRQELARTEENWDLLRWASDGVVDASRDLRNEITALENEQRGLQRIIESGNAALEVRETLSEVVTTATRRFYEGTVTLTAEQERLVASGESVAATQRVIKTVSDEATDSIDRQASAAERLASWLDALEREANPLAAATADYAAEVRMLTQAMTDPGTGAIANHQQFAELLDALRDRHFPQAADAAEDMGERITTSTAGMFAVIQNTFQRVDDTFQTLWDGAIDSVIDSTSTIATLFKDMLAQLAHAAITQPIVMRIGAAFTGALGGAGASGMGGGLLNVLTGGGGNMGDLIVGLLGGGAGFLGTGGIGGALGGALGSTLLQGPLASLLGTGAGQAFSGWLGGMLGAGLTNTILNAALPVVGTLIGAIAGDFLEDIFNDFFGRSFGGGVSGSMRNDNDGYVDSPFGRIVGTWGQGGFGHANDPESFFGQLARGMVEIDQALADLMTDNQIAAVTEALEAWSVDLTNSATAAEDAVRSRLGAIAEVFGGYAMEYTSGAATVEEQAEALGNWIQAFNQLAPVMDSFISSDPLGEIERSLEGVGNSTEQLQGFGSALQEAMDAFDGSPEQMAEIATLMDQRYRAEIEYLQATRTLIAGIRQSIDEQIAELRGVTADPEQVTMDSAVAGILAIIDQFASATSLEQIAAMVAEAQELARGAGAIEGITGADTEALVALLQQVAESSIARTEELQAAALAESEALRERAEVFRDGFGDIVTATSDGTDDIVESIDDGTERVTAGIESLREEQQENNALTRQLLNEFRRDRNSAFRTDPVSVRI